MKNKANAEKFTIVQASSLKQDLKDLGIDEERISVASIDAVNFYPSVSCRMIEKAVWFFAEDLDENVKKKLKVSLELLKIGMSTQTVQFNGTYCKCVGSSDDTDDPGLTIGGYELAFLSDLVAAFVFEEISPKLFDDNFLLNKIYRDNGMLVTKEKWDTMRFKRWID